MRFLRCLGGGLVLVGLSVALPGIALADAQRDAADALAAHRHAAQQARAAQSAAAARAQALAAQQVQAAAALRQLEDQTGQDTQTLLDLRAQQSDAGAKLLAAEAGLAKLLPVMQRLAAQPAATMLAAPESPEDAVRGIAIMQGIAAGISAQAQDVQVRSQTLLVLVGQAQDAQAKLSGAVAAQQAAEAALSSQIAAAKTDEMAAADTAATESAATLAAQKKLDSINEAVARLVKPSHLPPANLAAGAGGAPVAGRIIKTFGADTLAGPAQGVSYGAAAGARVTTPCAGTVMFAGPFPSYGQMVIADCGGGASVVLAGMARVDVAAGERLAHGQPVGAMLGYDKSDPTHQPVLYVELRKHGTPVDPQAWLAGGGSG